MGRGQQSLVFSICLSHCGITILQAEARVTKGHNVLGNVAPEAEYLSPKGSLVRRREPRLLAALTWSLAQQQEAAGRARPADALPFLGRQPSGA